MIPYILVCCRFRLVPLFKLEKLNKVQSIIRLKTVSWIYLMSKMRQPQQKKTLWECSYCKRRFQKRENVICHVKRNAKCSRAGAEAKYTGNEEVIGKDPDQNRESVEQFYNQPEEVIAQKQFEVKKSRAGFRHFPPALIEKIVAEGRELSKTNGRRKTTRIILETYPTAKLSRNTVDR